MMSVGGQGAAPLAGGEVSHGRVRHSAIGSIDAAEQALLQRARVGDEAAFVALVKCHHAMLVRMARLYVDDGADALAQEVWIVLLNGIDQLDTRRSLRVALLDILIGQLRDCVPAATTSRVPYAAQADPETDLASPSVDPTSFRTSDPWIGHWAVPVAEWGQVLVERLDSEAIRLRIEQAMATLPPAQREVVTLRDVEGWTSVEVSDALGIAETTQRSLLHRARSRIRACLDADLQQP
jgi:RNA polymerase sigma-70 factor, ECF subfamily